MSETGSSETALQRVRNAIDAAADEAAALIGRTKRTTSDIVDRLRNRE